MINFNFDKIEALTTKYVLKISIVRILQEVDVDKRLEILKEIQDMYQSELEVFKEVK